MSSTVDLFYAQNMDVRQGLRNVLGRLCAMSELFRSVKKLIRCAQSSRDTTRWLAAAGSRPKWAYQLFCLTMANNRFHAGHSSMTSDL